MDEQSGPKPPRRTNPDRKPLFETPSPRDDQQAEQGRIDIADLSQTYDQLTSKVLILIERFAQTFEIEGARASFQFDHRTTVSGRGGHIQRPCTRSGKLE